MAEVVLKTIFKFKRGTALAWKTINPVLAEAEPGYELDTGKLKIGDGSTSWNSLDYFGGEAHISPDKNCLVIDDKGSLTLYGFTDAGSKTIPMKDDDGKIVWVPLVASEAQAGLVKLYNTKGNNTDGTMTQKVITDELNEKVEVDVDLNEEIVIFSRDIE